MASTASAGKSPGAVNSATRALISSAACLGRPMKYCTASRNCFCPSAEPKSAFLQSAIMFPRMFFSFIERKFFRSGQHDQVNEGLVVRGAGGFQGAAAFGVAGGNVGQLRGRGVVVHDVSRAE